MIYILNSNLITNNIYNSKINRYEAINNVIIVT